MPPARKHNEKDPNEQPTFEETMESLEEIVRRIEAGEIGLEASIAEYEKGVGLIKRCREILDQAQQRVETLSKQGSAKKDSGQER
jgi:exodeoxyribonuclease VII small subunit